MDWDNARVFLAIYRRGTLRGAAAELQIDQATAGRRLAALEEALDARLFLRTPKRYVPTPAGDMALRAAERTEAGALALQRRMQGLDDRLEGTVSLACTNVVATVFLMPALSALRRRHPGLMVRMIASTQLSDLTRREADLAVRPVRPDAPDLIVRHLGQRAVGLCASREYLDVRGVPEAGTGLAGHDIVVYDSSIGGTRRDVLCGEPAGGAHVALAINTGMTKTSSGHPGRLRSGKARAVAAVEPSAASTIPTRSGTAMP
jgi:DNA-binding transcriptional LysR family regulator